MKKILIIDDDEGVRCALSKYLKDKRYYTDEADSGKVGIMKAMRNDFDVVLLDQIMPESNGMNVLLELKKNRPATKVIMMTGFATINSAVEAIKKGASEYLQKPFNVKELDIIIKRCLEEESFNKTLKKLDLDFALSSLSNPIRRKIIRLLMTNKGIHLMKITRALNIDDHTKVVFHLKSLKEAGLIKQDEDKGYNLTKEGKKAYECLRIIEEHIS